MKKLFTLIISFIILFTCNVYALEYNVSTESELINALTNQTESDVINFKVSFNFSG